MTSGDVSRTASFLAVEEKKQAMYSILDYADAHAPKSRSPMGE
jgi:hypothetical protein